MKKWIRLQGVAAFAVVCILLAAFWWLAVDCLIERAIEKAGTAAVGAEVELDKADLTLFPLGLALTRLQITDPNRPMTNAVEIGRIAGAIDGLNLFRRKVIVEEMTMDGIRFGTARKTSGALSERPTGKALESRSGRGGFAALPDLSLRDPKEILAGEDLQSLKLAEALQRDLEAEKTRWRKNLAELPDRAKLKDYQQRLENLKGTGKGGIGSLAGNAGEAAKLQTDLKRDLARLQDAKTDFARVKSDLRKRYEEASKAPSADIRRLMEKYSLSGSGLANLSASLLGGAVGGWIETALAWHAKLDPLLSRTSEGKAGTEIVKPLRGKGVDVRFPERMPLPDFLVKRTNASVEFSAGTIRGQIRNITPDQPVLGAPLTFTFAGENLQELKSLRLDGEVNRVNPAKPLDQVAAVLRGVKLNDFSFGETGGIGLTLKQASADLDAKAKLAGPSLAAVLSSRVQSVEMAAQTKADAGPVAAAVSRAIGGVNAFRATADVSGTLQDYKIHLSSDLDQVLKNAVGKQLHEQLGKFQRDLQAAVMDKVKGPLGGVNSEIGGLDGVGKEIADRLNIGEGLLKSGVGKSGLKLPF